MEEVTFCMVKPDAAGRGKTGEIIAVLEKKGFAVLKARQMKLTPAFCENFYQEHCDKSFFSSLIHFMASGPVMAMALKRESACSYLREVMGGTDPKSAEPSTIRALFGETIERNSIHGSDSLKSARRELSLFFPEELF